ncbi:hypothetical protein K435DRAFT_802292 [Dendrothele bispora CBS 962.96]|uniref:Uncharacterized protein n=1 Tax=Dendrothele bispora (strain CBS 962.96) TaxID=1314807 RepID=A0A4S8LLA4_DENBC|nr:hypothetical protein K435DRAFT_802292 [Dendrothele bispora CBS 962.96]
MSEVVDGVNSVFDGSNKIGESTDTDGPLKPILITLGVLLIILGIVALARYGSKNCGTKQWHEELEESKVVFLDEMPEVYTLERKWNVRSSLIFVWNDRIRNEEMPRGVSPVINAFSWITLGHCFTQSNEYPWVAGVSARTNLNYPLNPRKLSDSGQGLWLCFAREFSNYFFTAFSARFQEFYRDSNKYSSVLTAHIQFTGAFGAGSGAYDGKDIHPILDLRNQSPSICAASRARGRAKRGEVNERSNILFGPPLIGLLFNGILFGVLAVQAHLHFNWNRRGQAKAFSLVASDGLVILAKRFPGHVRDKSETTKNGVRK